MKLPTFTSAERQMLDDYNRRDHDLVAAMEATSDPVERERLGRMLGAHRRDAPAFVKPS